MSELSNDLVKNTIKLTQHNWSTWSIVIKTLLRAKGCWSVCVESPPKPAGNDSKSGDADKLTMPSLTAKEYEKADAVALSIFHQTVSDSLRQVVLRDSAREAWAALNKKFNKKSTEQPR